uniref:Ard1-prov protein, related n=1 Tax=Neospora caninum (strain Liverpool) TaxID=572307 RepID=A0A0F7UHE3_NEOCL|nr:TPA: Ard1-prov protein, related [Neospora caninum Liverpool]
MSRFRPMTAGDLFRFNAVNLDGFTETFLQSFYLRYLSNWPELCIVADGPDGTVAGYIIGKVEGKGRDWHGHVTALSVAPEFRKCGLARKLMAFLEDISEKKFKCYYVDLYVRVSNTVAVNFYRELGYRVWKTEKGYYSGQEDALDMRKPLSHDTELVCLKGAEEPL